MALLDQRIVPNIDTKNCLMIQNKISFASCQPHWQKNTLVRLICISDFFYQNLYALQVKNSALKNIIFDKVIFVCLRSVKNLFVSLSIMLDMILKFSQ